MGMIQTSDAATETRARAPRAAAALGWIKPIYGLALLVALQMWLIVHHSPWRDELQAYLIARDSHGLADLFANMHYEGHPSLWFLVLRAAQAVFHSPLALTATQAVVALSVTALVWRKAPFPAWLRLLVLAGYFLLFEYGVIARNYGLGVVLAFAWLPLRRSLWGWAILALMPNVAVHFALLSTFLVLALLWIERRGSWIGLGLWAAGGLLALLTIIPAHDVTTGLDFLHQPLAVRLLDALRRLAAPLFPAYVGLPSYQWQVLPLYPAGQIIGAVTGLLCLLAVRREPRASWIALGLYVTLIALSALLYTTYLRHVGVLVLLVIALEWMRMERRADGGATSPVFAGWMGINAVCGLWAAGWALVVPFSPGQQEIAWIRAHHLQAAAWASYPGYAGTDLSAFFGRPTYNLQKGCLNTFIRWDTHAYDDVDDDVLSDRISDPGPYAYLVSDQDLSQIGAPIHQIARFGRGLGDNDQFLYAVDRPQAGVGVGCR